MEQTYKQHAQRELNCHCAARDIVGGQSFLLVSRWLLGVVSSGHWSDTLLKNTARDALGLLKFFRGRCVCCYCQNAIILNDKSKVLPLWRVSVSSGADAYLEMTVEAAHQSECIKFE